MKSLKVGDMLENFTCYVKSITERKTKKGAPFLTLVLANSKGELSTNVWNQDAATWIYGINSVVKISGQVTEYQGSPQLNVTAFLPSDQPLSDFGRVSGKDPEWMMEELHDVIKCIEDPFISYLIKELVCKEPYNQKFMRAPAARGVHHPWIHGLLEHVLGLCRLASGMEGHYRSYFPTLSLDKVYFGLIMHDWGKIAEYDYSTPNISYTKRGCLQHHIGIVCERLTVKKEEYLAANIKPNERTRVLELFPELLHLIYSHHGIPEWSALMKPATIEAILVHHLDNMDAKMMHAYEYIHDGVEGNVPGMSKWSNIEGGSYVLPN